jgi:hypothetical protein
MLFGLGIPMKLVRLIKMCMNETCSTVCVGEHLSDMFPIKKCLKQERRVLENTILRRIFGPKRGVVTRGRRKPHKDLNELYQIFR